LSDQGTIEMIQENIYMQFFVGLDGFQTKPIFDSSLFVTIRKRLGKETFDELNEYLIQNISAKSDQKNITKKRDDDSPPPNKGKLQADATVADQYITYPTDSKLLNASRKKLEEMIDKLYAWDESLKLKPRTYRRKLDTAFLNYSKKKRKSHKDHRKVKRKLLTCLKRNLRYIDQILPNPEELILGKDYPLDKVDLDMLKTIKELYTQQKQMYDSNTRKCDNRIVSIHQPHVRPIARGKQNAQVEFGSKLGVSLDNGFARIHTLSWDAYNESKDLISQVESYFSIHGYYPELVQVDKIYATRENRKWLQERDIRITAPPLGRKAKTKMNHYQKAKRKQEAAERNHIEGKFGQGKNKYGLNKIQARLKDTSETWISCIFFIMNLINYRKKASSVFIYWQYIPHIDIEGGLKRIYSLLKSTLTKILNFRLFSYRPNQNFQSTSKMIFQ
jgi:IS5 family transposase